MKKFFAPLLLTFLSSSYAIAQCTADISAPTVAISNCTGPQINGTATGSAPLTFSWSVTAPGSLSSTTVSNPTVSSTGPGEVIVTFIVMDGTGCTAFDQDTIMFYTPTDTFDYYFCSYPDTICPLPLAMLGSPSWTYTDSSGSSSSLTTIPGGCVSVTQPGTYGMFGVYVSACTVNHTYLVYDTCGFTPGPCSVSVDIGPDILAISNCTGPNLTSTASGVGALTYVWSGGPNISFNSPNTASTTVSSSTPGVEVITLTVTDSTGCIATNNMNITFYYPTDTFYYNFVCLPDSICTLPIPTIGTISWTYYPLSGGPSSAAGNTSCINATMQGTYELFTIYESNCTVIHKYIVTDSCGTSIFEHAALVEAELYPNPANDQVTIRAESQMTTISIWNMMGELVFTKTNLPKGKGYTLNISSLTNGSYIMHIKTEKGFVNKRLVKIGK